MKKHYLIIGGLIVIMIACAVLYFKSRRQAMINTLVERLGLSAEQLKTKTDEELAAMINSLNSI